VAINVTRWRPDTCGCTLEYSWDSEDDPEARTHTPVRAEPCEAHAAHTKEDVCYEAVLAENQGKNIFIGEIHKEIPAVADPSLVADVVWSFDADRKLVIEPVGLSKAELAKLQALQADEKFADKVAVVEGK
jgi:hypothetical protein